MPLSAEAGARTPAMAERTNVTTAAVLIVSFWAAGKAVPLLNLVLGEREPQARIFSKSIFPWDPLGLEVRRSLGWPCMCPREGSSMEVD